MYCRYFYPFDHRSPSGQHSAGTGISFGKFHQHPAANDPWMSQCNHVQPVHLRFRISSALRLRCYRQSLSSPGTGAACQHDGLYTCLLQESKKRPYRRSFLDLFREFNLKSARSQWYLSLTWIVCSAMFIMQLLSLPRAMWAGIACMSVCLPFPEDSKGRTWKRGVFNILGCGIFLVLYNTLPAWLYPYIGVIGGIGVGYSAGYSWQTVFNTFGALSIASSLFGVKTAIALRIGTNVAGALYAFLSWQILSRLLPVIFCEKDYTSLAMSSK